MDMVSSNQARIDVVSGDVFVGSRSQPLTPVSGEYNVSHSNSIWANPNAKYVINTTSGSQTVEVDCVTCVTFNEDGAIVLAQLDSMTDVNLDELQRSQLTPEDIAIIRSHLPPQETNEDNHSEQETQDDEGDDDIEAPKPDVNSIVETASSGFVEVDYDGDAILTKAGYDTQGFSNEVLAQDNSEEGIPLVKSPGGVSASLSLTEADLQPLGYSNNLGYPVVSQQSVLVESRTMALQPDTFTFQPQSLEALLQELNSELTSGGEAISFVFDAESNAIIGSLNGEVYLTIQLTASSPDGRDVQLDIEVNLAKPLDHLSSANSTGLVSNVDDKITINFEVQGEDIGGNELNSPILVDVNINDGVVQQFGTDPGVFIDEGSDDDIGTAKSGQVPLDIGSDDIQSILINSSQPFLDTITSQGLKTSYTVESNLLTVYNVLGEKVFTLEVHNDGTYDATLFRPFDQGSADQSEAGIAITGIDSDGDTAPGIVNIVVADGSIKTGGETGQVAMIEADTNPDEYPVVGKAVSINDRGETVEGIIVYPNTDRLDANTIQYDGEKIDALLAELGQELTTTGGEEITFALNADDPTIIEGWANGQLVLTIDIDGSLAPFESFLGIKVDMTVTQYQPLDHNSDGNSSGYVSVDGDKIVIKAPVQVMDTDNQDLTKPVVIEVTISDGDIPQFSIDSGTSLNETDELNQVINGSVPLDIGSDAIATLTFDDIQSAFDGVTSNGNPTSVDLNDDGNVLTLSNDDGQPLLVVTISPDGTYTVVVSGPIDQPDSETNHFELPVTAIDNDGDSAKGVAVIDITDGVNASGAGVIAELQVTEGDLTDSTSSNYPSASSDAGNFTITAPNDDLVASSLDIEPEIWDTLQADLQQLRSGDVSLTITKTVVDGVVTLTAMAGTIAVFSLVFTPTAQADGSVSVAMSFEQTAPLDHDMTFSSDFIQFTPAPDGSTQDIIDITVPVQIKDTDGDWLTDENGNLTPVNVGVTITDGIDPVVGNDSMAFIEINGASSEPQPGSFSLEVGSDTIDNLRFELTADQQSILDNLTSNGYATEVSNIDGVITVYIPGANGGADTPVLVITLDNDNKDGTYTVQQFEALDQPTGGDTTTDISLNVIATDKDNDESNVGSIDITITDGADASGGSASITITEPDLVNVEGESDYPLIGDKVTLTLESGVDRLLPESVVINPNPLDETSTDLKAFLSELSTELTSGGQAIIFSVNPDTGALEGKLGDGTLVLELTLKPSQGEDGDVAVDMVLTQNLPLDHMIDGDSTGLVTESDGNITFNVPIQVKDSDGDYLTPASNVMVTINDGDKPSLGTSETVDITEVEADQPANGSIALDVGSDSIASIDFALSAEQLAVLEALQSNDQDTSVQVIDGQIIVYIPSDPGTDDGTYTEGTDTPVLIIELNNIDKNGSYTVTQYEALEQPYSETSPGTNDITLDVIATDFDGDPSEPGSIHIVIKDGEDPSFALDDGLHFDEDAAVAANGAGVTKSNGQVVLTVGSDDIATITFDSEQPTFDKLTSNGKATTFEISTDGTTLTVYEVGGSTDDPVMTITLDDLEGNYSVTLYKPIDQNADNSNVTDDETKFNVGITATDTDKDSAPGEIIITIEDGTNASGSSVVAKLDVVEGDLENSANTQYPTATTELNPPNSFTIPAVDDYLDPTTLYIDSDVWTDLQIDLQTLTSNGESLVVTQTTIDGVITITATANGEPVFTLTFTPSQGDNGDVNVVMTMELNAPLDHQDVLDSDYIDFTAAAEGSTADTIDIKVPIQIKDTDGDALITDEGIQEPVDVVVTINDGQDPVFNVSSQATVLTDGEVSSEADSEGVISKSLDLDTNSDAIDAITFNLTDAQRQALLDITSNGNDTRVDFSVDGRILVFIHADFEGNELGSDTPVLEIIFDNTAKDGSYTIQQFEPIDQPEDSNSSIFELDVIATDMDGDTDGSSITITINDGADPNTSNVSGDSSISVNEGDLNDNGQSLIYPGNEKGTGTFAIAAASDDLDPTTLTIDNYAGFKSTVDGMGLESNGRAVTIDETLVVNDDGVITVTGTTADGSVIFILTFTPTLNEDGSVTVEMSLDQKQPLDHLTSDSLSFDVPLQIADTDGDYLVSGGVDPSIDINVSFIDGKPPVLTSNEITFTEADVSATDPQTHKGQVGLEIGSDSIKEILFTSSLGEDGATGLTSNGYDVLIDDTTPGEVRYYYLDGSDEQVDVLTVTITGTDGSYEVKQYEPLDQANSEGDNTVIELEVVATDKDGDPSNNATITINVNDGTDPQFIPDDSNIILNESGDSGVVNTTGQVEVTLGSDDVKTIEFSADLLDESGNLKELTITSNGESTSWEITGDTATLLANDGTTALIVVTIDNTGSYNVTVSGPIDQEDSELTQIELGLVATDSDDDTADGSLVFSVTDGQNAEGGQTGSISITESILSEADTNYVPAPTETTGNIAIAAGVEKLDATTVQIKPSDLDTLTTELEADLTSGGKPLVFIYDEATATLIGYVNGDESQPALTIVLTASQDGSDVNIQVKMTQHLPLDHDQDGSGANTSGLVTVNDTDIHINLPVQVQDTDGDYLDEAVNVDLNIVDGGLPSFTVDTGVVVDESGIDEGGNNHQGSDPTAVSPDGSPTETASGQIDITLGSDNIDTFKIDAEQFSSLNSNLTSQGQAVTMVENDDGTFSGIAGEGTENEREVFIVTFSPDGSYSFTITGALDHQKPGNDESLDIQLPIYAVDKDGDRVPNTTDVNDYDESNTITVTVNDDVPDIKDLSVNVTEGETELLTIVPENEGADSIGSLTLSFISEEGEGVTPHTAPFTDVPIYDEDNGGQLLGTLTLDTNGKLTFTADPNLNNENEDLSVNISVHVVDKDGDENSSTLTLNLTDQDPFFILPDSFDGEEEDGQTLDDFDNTEASPGIPVSFSIDLGDVDRGETLDSVTITLPEPSHGQFYLEGSTEPLSPDVNNQITIPVDAFNGPDDDGVLELDGLTFVPDKDYSSDGLHFEVNADISTNDGEPPRSITGDLVIKVDGIADIPVWNDASTVTEYIGTEDGAIAIDGLVASLNDNDGSESLYYVVQIAEGYSGTLSGTGLEEITLSDGSTAYRISEGNIDTLMVTPDKDFSGDIHINAWAQSQESDPFVVETADSEMKDIVVRVQPDADEDLTLKVTRVESDEDVAINLADHITLNHPSDAVDGSETLYVRLSNLPEGAQLLLNGTAVELESDGSYEILYSELDQLQFLPPPESSGDFTLTINGVVYDDTTYDGTTSANPHDEYITESKDINVAVKGVADEPIIEVDEGSDWSLINYDETDKTSDGVEITIPEDGMAPFDFHINSGEINALPGDESETISVVISGIPEGVQVFSEGEALEVTYVGQDSEGRPIYQVELDNLDSIKIQPPLNSTEDIELTANVVVTEEDGDSAVFEKDIIIHVEPVIDLGDTYISNSTGIEDELVTLNWQPEFTDTQEYVTSLTIMLPDGANTDGYSLFIAETDGSSTELFFDENGELNLDAYLDALNNGAELKISMPENSDKDFQLTTNITVQQDDADEIDPEDSAIKTDIVGTLDVDVQAKVEDVGDPYDNSDESSGKIVISNGLDEDGDGIIDDLGTVPCDENGVVDLSSGGVGTIMFAENDFSSDEEIIKLVIDFSGISIPEGQGFVVIGAVNNGDGSWTVKDGNLENIQIQAPAGFTDTVDIKVLAKVEDKGDDENSVSEEVIINGEITLDFSNNTNEETDLAADIIVEDTVVTGTEDEGINLGSQLVDNNSISVSSTDQNGDGESEIPNDVMTVVIDASDLPDGASITGAEFDFETGQYVYEATLNADGTVNLSGLGLVPPEDYAGDFQFPIKYISTDTESGDVNEATQTVTVNVDPVVDAGLDANLGLESQGLDDNKHPVSESGGEEVVYDGIAYEDALIILDISDITFDDSRNTIEEGLEEVQSVTIEVDPLMGHFLDSNDNLVSELTLNPDELSGIKFVPFEDFSGQVDFTVSAVVTDTATFDLDGDRTEVDTRTTGEVTISLDVVAVNDDVLVETTREGNIVGEEDSAGGISLAGGTVTLQDIDGSEEIVSIILTGIPEGFIVQGAVNNGDGTWTITDATGLQSYSLEGLYLVPPKNFSGTIEVGVVVYTKEESLDEIVAIEKSMTVEVTPVADEIDTDVVTSAQGSENADIELILDISTVDHQSTSTLDTENAPENIQITISNVPVDMGASFSFPDGVTGEIIDNGDGTWTITTNSGQLDSLIFNPGDANNNNWDGQLELDIRAVDNGVVAEESLGTQTTINVDVAAVNDAPVNTVPEGTLSGVEGETMIIDGLAISDVDEVEGSQMTVTLSTDNGVLSVPDEYTGSVTIDGDDSGNLILVGSLADINDLLSGGIEYVPATGGGDATITMKTNDDGNTGSGGILTDTDDIIVSVAAPTSAMMSTFGISTRMIPNITSTAAQLALIPLLGLLSEHVEALESGHIKIQGLDSGKVVDASGQPLGEQQDDGSWVVDSQDLANAYLSDLEEGQHNLTVVATSEDPKNQDSTSDSPSIKVDLTIEPDGVDVLNAQGNSEHSVIIGSDSDETLIGTEGHDTLMGGLGNDILVGAGGSDILIGGAGNDELWGGERNGSGDGEADTFVWYAQDIDTQIYPATDVIKDFELDLDKIDIRDLFSDRDSSKTEMDEILSHITASEDEGKINLTVNTDKGGEQVIVLDNISINNLGLDSGASSNDIVSSLYAQHNAFMTEHNS